MSSVSSSPVAPVSSVTTEVRVKAEEAGVSQGKPSGPQGIPHKVITPSGVQLTYDAGSPDS